MIPEKRITEEKEKLPPIIQPKVELNPNPTLLSSKTNYENSLPFDGSHLSSKTNYENVRPSPDHTYLSSKTNYENIDKTVTPEPEKISAPPMPPKSESNSGPIPSIPDTGVSQLTGAKMGVGDKIKDLSKKYGVGILDMLEAGLKGYSGNTSPTSLDVRTEQAYKDKENEFFQRLSENKAIEDEKRAEREAARDAALYNERLTGEREYETGESEKDRALQRELSGLKSAGTVKAPMTVSSLYGLGGS